MTAALAGLRVLVVDNDLFVRRIFTMQLKRAGASVIEAAGGDAAIALLGEMRAAGDPPAAVVCDLNMPPPSGLDVLRELRHLFGGTVAAIVVTAHDDDSEAMAELLQMGFTTVLPKPVQAAVLIETVARHARPDDAAA